MRKKEETNEVIEEILLEEGIDIDINEGWHKLISSQFGGNPWQRLQRAHPECT